MNFEEAFQVVDAAVFGQKQRHLKDIEVAILHGSWQGKKYHEIAQVHGYTVEYLKQDVGPKLWKLLSRILGEKVSKTNFRSALARRSLLVQSSLTKICPVQIFQDYGKSFRSEEQKSEQSQLNLVINSSEQITTISGLEIKLATDEIYLNFVKSLPVCDNQHQGC